LAAADIVLGGVRGQVARTKSARRKSADELRSAEEAVLQRQLLAAPWGHVAALAATCHAIGAKP
jgi:hypothetical protein